MANNVAITAGAGTNIATLSYNSGTQYQEVITGGEVAVACPASAAVTVVKATPGRLCRVLVTTTGVTPMIIYDNATAASGTIIGCFPASPAVGTVINLDFPAVNGITISAGATNPAVTVSYI